ncbi:uncharacterized protein LOC120920891 [Rana temporaria]|uniref:uncharacterized protein LOC120920891 n=1 Tax=Rana temporaria TaxID=8407 RepID=UPI001AADA736|nr:uncharacterized protein LOC120920891 [Rana temporaria]
MPGCMAKDCMNYTKKGDKESRISYFTFPKDDQKIKEWLHNAGMDPGMIEEYIPIIKADKHADSYRMCSSHFTNDCFTMRGTQRRLVTNAAPTIFTDVPKKHNTDNKWLLKLKKIWRNEQPKESTSSENFDSLTCHCQCHQKYNIENVSKLEAGTQTTEPSTHFIISEPPTAKVASPRSYLMDHPYCNFEEPLMSPMYMSTPEIQKRRPEVRELIDNSPSMSFMSPPSKRQKNAMSLVGKYYESPDLESKKKLLYADDPSFHESDCETPQKSDMSLCESLPDRELQNENIIPHPLNLVHEKKFIVFESCLDKILYAMMCPEFGCSSQIYKIEKIIIGTMITVYSTCRCLHRLKLWESQPKIKQYAAGNILLAGAITLSGGSYAKVREMFDLCGIAIFGKTSFNKAQTRYVHKAVDISWQKNLSDVTKELKGKPVFIIGDGQCDSPGYSAKYSTYTCMDLFTKKIVDFDVVQVSQTTSSVAMEKLGFTNCLDRIIEKFDVQFVGTDRHTGIRKLMATKEKYKKIEHQFDTWHYVKNINRKLLQLAKKSINKGLLPWVRPVLLHFYFCSAHCKGEEDVFRNIWQSVLHHVINEHEWEIDGVKKNCLHDPMSVDSRRVAWLRLESPAFQALSSIVLDAQLNKDLKHLTHFCQTGIIETYHSMILKFRPKRIHYRYDSMETRTKLAALCHNYNAIRKPALTKKTDESGQEVLVERKNIEFPRGRKKWIVRNVYEKMDTQHNINIMADMISIVEGKLVSSWKSKNREMPANIAPVERPETSVLVKEHMTRFSKFKK